MATSDYTVKEIVDRAVRNDFGMPEFQRGFVWPPAKVMHLVDSLFSDFPVGALLLWRPESGFEAVVGRTSDSNQPSAWIVDGQQRTTAMCLLFGHKPYWWHSNQAEWEATCQKYNIHVNPLPPDVQFETPKRTINQDPNFVSVRDILNGNDGQIEQIAERLQENNPDKNPMSILRALQNVQDIGKRSVTAFEQTNSIEDTVEIFVRLNQSGTKVNEGDIALALVASQNPSWVNDTFKPFMDELASAGYELEPTLVLRSMIAAETDLWDGVITRLGRVDRTFWEGGNLIPRWKTIEGAWRRIIDGLKEFGIFNSDMLPSKNALIPLVAMAVFFGQDFRINPALAWLLRATCTNRYSRTTDTRLAEDIRAIREPRLQGFAAAVQNAIDVLTKQQALDFSADDNTYFKRSYRDKEVQIMLHLLAFDNEAHDWSSQAERIGFAGTDLQWECTPNWHHIFPRAYLNNNEVDLDIVDSAANIVVIGKASNLKIGPRSPMEYMEGVSDKLLREQYVPTDRSLFTIDHYDEFLEQRAKLLADAANEFMGKLEQGLTARQDEAA